MSELFKPTNFFCNFGKCAASLQSWGDVYFFCGPEMQYCTCDLEWNLDGWLKALVLWNFVLASVLAVQKLIIAVGLNGLLPGCHTLPSQIFTSNFQGMSSSLLRLQSRSADIEFLWNDIQVSVSYIIWCASESLYSYFR